MQPRDTTLHHHLTRERKRSHLPLSPLLPSPLQHGGKKPTRNQETRTELVPSPKARGDRAAVIKNRARSSLRSDQSIVGELLVLHVSLIASSFPSAEPFLQHQVYFYSPTGASRTRAEVTLPPSSPRAHKRCFSRGGGVSPPPFARGPPPPPQPAAVTARRQRGIDDEAKRGRASTRYRQGSHSSPFDVRVTHPPAKTDPSDQKKTKKKHAHTHPPTTHNTEKTRTRTHTHTLHTHTHTHTHTTRTHTRTCRALTSPRH